MLLLIGAYIASMIPAVLLILWLRNRKGMPEGHTAACDKALKSGILTIFPVVLCSAILNIGVNLVFHLKDGDPVLYRMYYAFIVLAFSEELCKFLAMRRIVRKGSYSWLSVIIIMTMVGLGFEIMESVVYAIGSGPGPMFVRGLTLMHGAFAIIMGYFYGKFLNTGKKAYVAIAFLVPWIIHGSYDFFLSEEMAKLEWPGYVALLLAVLCAVLVIVFIRFVVKARNNEKYTEIIVGQKQA